TTGRKVKAMQTLNVTASDNVGVVGGDIRLDGTPIASFSGSSVALDWNTTHVADGTHTLQSSVEDAAGNVGRSSPVSVTVANNTDTTPPTATITYPANGSRVYRGWLVSITAE